MLAFLSDDWIKALDAAGSTGPSAPAGSSGSDPVLTIEQHVTGHDDTGTTYFIVVYDDGIRVRPGPAVEPDVSFIADRETAASIAQGTLSAQAAFMSGALRLVGEASALLRAQTVLVDLADRFAVVRTRTQW